MKKVMLFFMSIFCLTAINGHSQGFATPPVLRIGDLATGQVTYNQILKYPKVVYSQQGCAVANYDVTISDRGRETYGPYRVKGAELPPYVRATLQQLKGYGSTITVDSILVKCNGKITLLDDWLEYTCKSGDYVNYLYY
jgi:hypothetical protein